MNNIIVGMTMALLTFGLNAHGTELNDAKAAAAGKPPGPASGQISGTVSGGNPQGLTVKAFVDKTITSSGGGVTFNDVDYVPITNAHVSVTRKLVSGSAGQAHSIIIYSITFLPLNEPITVLAVDSHGKQRSDYYSESFPLTLTEGHKSQANCDLQYHAPPPPPR